MIKKTKKKVRDIWKLKIGQYEPITEKGKIKWDVRTEKGGGYLANTQFEAEVISRLVRIENSLRQIKKL